MLQKEQERNEDFYSEEEGLRDVLLHRKEWKLLVGFRRLNYIQRLET